ncbi:AAA family ATPase [Stenotrophomonas sp.]|uniref:AAA family ATPase n=1 Tax=Stenotrophomonas sp. TaxID=69392 RepID=UPI0028A5BBA1|nr:AAA family ATPase [Stenotrophomonas sp.]
MITALTTEGFGFQRRLQIVSRGDYRDGWITVFIAENGCKKSLLLRCLAEHAMGRRTRESGLVGRVDPAARRPHRVIALSGTPLDRFPRVGTTDLKSRRKRVSAANSFVYIGPRASNGMAGIGQSERSFVGSLIANRADLVGRSENLSRAFSFVGLAPSVAIYLEIAQRLDSESFVRGLHEYIDELSAAGLGRNSEVVELKRALGRFGSAGALSIVASKLRESIQRGVAQITLSEGYISVDRGLSVALLELLMRSGALEISRTEFTRVSDGVKISGDHLSSGQWSWLGTFGGLALEIREETLTLVDEPENSLHPKWQRSFVPELRRIVSGYAGGQVVVATHSPLIASGISPDWGQVRTLSRGDRSNSVVNSQPLLNVFGWNSSDVYDGIFGLESSRSPDFLREINSVLAVIAANESISKAHVAGLRKKLRSLSNSLPDFDPMKNILIGSIKRVEELGRRK